MRGRKLGCCDERERQQSPFSFAKRLYVIEYLGENETFAEKDTMRGRK